jgi:hypothetical protein
MFHRRIYSMALAALVVIALVAAVHVPHTLYRW